MNDQNKNLILASVLSFIVIITWFILFPPPEPVTRDMESAQQQSEESDLAPNADTSKSPLVETGETEIAVEAERLQIENELLTGSISTQGGRIDQLSLKKYRNTISENSDIVTLLSPVGKPKAYYAAFGWAPSVGIKPDQYLRTSNKKIYAIGDVTHFENFTNVANHHAGIVLKSITIGLKTKVQKEVQPRVIYTTPEIGSVGLSKVQATKKYGGKLKISRVNFSENDRAITDNKKLGWIEIYIYRNLVVGASVIGIGAGELLNFWSFMISNRILIYKIAKTSFAYPTLGEVNKKLVTNYLSPKIFKNRGIRNLVWLAQRYLP